MTTCTSRAAWVHLLRRLHFFIGLFVGPFIFVAALTGTLYVATPQLENLLYRQALQGEMTGERHPLVEQIAVAKRTLETPLRLSAVRPALEAGETTRIMFDDPTLAPSENRAIFIDPVTLAVKGDMTVYGTSGILPLRQWIDATARAAGGAMSTTSLRQLLPQLRMQRPVTVVGAAAIDVIADAYALPWL